LADISALGELRPIEPLDLENYADNKEFTSIPKAGRYIVQAPPEFPSAAFGRTKANHFSAQIDPTIVGPTNEGFKLRFIKVSAKAFKRNGKTVSQLTDYLRATGLATGKLADEQALADAIEATANRTYEVDLDWRAYNKDTQYSIEGMERFPSDGNGGHLPFTTDPNAKDPETGEPVRLRAQLVVSRFVPASL
jgi:hypothetical protein